MRDSRCRSRSLNSQDTSRNTANKYIYYQLSRTVDMRDVISETWGGGTADAGSRGHGNGLLLAYLTSSRYCNVPLWVKGWSHSTEATCNGGLLPEIGGKNLPRAGRESRGRIERVVLVSVVVVSLLYSTSELPSIVLISHPPPIDDGGSDDCYHANGSYNSTSDHANVAMRMVVILCCVATCR